MIRALPVPQTDSNLNRTGRRFLLIGTLLVACSVALGQNPQFPTSSRAFPTLIFSCVEWGKNPSSYSIAIDSTGNTTYKSTPDSARRTGNPYVKEFVASEPTRSKIFRLAERLNFLKGQQAATVRTQGQRNQKTLTFREGKEHSSISFQTATDPRVRELATLFEKMSATLEYGRRLASLYGERDPQLDVELGQLQTQAKNHGLIELQSLTPVLNKIASDSKLDVVTRNRAKALLAP